LGAIPFGDTMDIAQLLDLINIFKGAIQFFETTNRTMSLQEAIQIYRNLNLTIPPLDDSMLSAILNNLNGSEVISSESITNFLSKFTSDLHV
jgi:hypothetical protein